MAESDGVDFAGVAVWLRDWHQEAQRLFAAEDEGGVFVCEEWQREDGGGGLSCMRRGGRTFEQLGVNFSEVRNVRLPASATENRPQLAGTPFRAVGVSIVAHTRNPHAPASHANLRCFVSESEQTAPLWWFGGGCDLTPCYAYEEDCRQWHEALRDACHPFGETLYPRLKKWCDEYFYLPHRREMRGVGGLFFDDWTEGGFERCFAFLRSVGECYPRAYLSLVRRRRAVQYGEGERAFQLYRRGRYAEFNLLFDRGTRFGLESGGRTASILMSLPPLVRWQQDWQPPSGSAEERLEREFLKPRDWLND